MSDLFREVDEEVRRDQIARIWQRHGALISAVVVLLVLAVAGWRYYEFRRVQAAQAAAAEFEQALSLAKADKTAEAKVAFDKIAAGGSGGYALFARFRAAAEQAKTDVPGAVKTFDAIANDASVSAVLQDLARIRAATLLVDTADTKEISARIEGLATPTNAWRNGARELLGLAAYRAGDLEGAGKWFDALIVDPSATTAERQRAELMLELVRGGALPKS